MPEILPRQAASTIKAFAVTCRAGVAMISLTLISMAHDDLQRLVDTQPTAHGGAGVSRGVALLASAVAVAAAAFAVVIGH
ncbi:MAG: hypothetical protein H7Z15_10445 [Rhizobacter sp.]|nr:hypothetical protein [Rhizobacter sp.]